MIQRHKIKTETLQTLSWLKDNLIDWASAGTKYTLNGQKEQIAKYHFAYSFDAAITSDDGVYAFLYKKLGTKGLLLKNGKELREINRSYYQAEVYEYPASFLKASDGNTYLVHCPIRYCQLDFENVETGEIPTNTLQRNPGDIFHSRLEISPDNKYLISKAWVWHPWDIIELFNIEACFANPSLLDKGLSIPNNSSEICSASFIDNESILVCSSQEEPLDDELDEPIPPKHIAIWNFKENSVSKAIRVNGVFGHLIAIDRQYCWDLYKYPKIINIETGEIEDKIEDIDSGQQTSSIIHHISENIPLLAYSRVLQKLACVNNDCIEILYFEKP